MPSSPSHHLTEHRFDQLQLANISTGNYNVRISYCRQYSFKDGNYIFVHNNLYFTPVHLNAYFSDYDIEICEVKLHSLLFHLCYFPSTERQQVISLTSYIK